jgi:hypothetical protein
MTRGTRCTGSLHEIVQFRCGETPPLQQFETLSKHQELICDLPQQGDSGSNTAA